MGNRSGTEGNTAAPASVIAWLLDADPALRWQVMRDLMHAPAADIAAERAGEAVRLLESKQDDRGHWSLETRYPGEMPIQLGEREGQASRWKTLRALRVLDWYTNGG